MQAHNANLFFAIAVVFYALTRLGLFMLFKKAGKPGWLALVPVLSWWHWAKLVNRPWYYVLLLCIPVVNVIAGFTITIDLLRSFGQFRLWQQILGVIFPFAYLPYVGFSKETAYLGPSHSEDFKKKHPAPSGAFREWGDALFFAVFVAGVIRGFYVEAYKIPTPSMEGNLMVGDYLFVSRVHYGARVPMTPLAIPLAHQDLLGMKAYSSLLGLPYMRLPGWRKIKNNDPVVFNYPMDEGHPIDKQQNYIKRCIGLPGDSLAIRDRVVFINGKELPASPNQQYSYFFRFKEPLRQETVDQYELYDIYPPAEVPKGYDYIIHTSQAKYLALKASQLVDTSYIQDRPGSGDLYPEKPGMFPWTLDNFGPIYIPRKGATVALNAQNWPLYQRIIQVYENHPEIDLDGEGKQLLSNGSEPVTSYTFEQNYYWMMGDNRHNSLDSRYWGFVPETHIIGPPLFVFFSIREKRTVDPTTGFVGQEGSFGGIRWNRIFKAIH